MSASHASTAAATDATVTNEDANDALALGRWWPESLDLPVEGPAFSSLHRLLATAMMAALVTLGWRAAPEVGAAFDRQWAAVWLVLALAAAAVVAGYITVMTARTRVTATSIEQRGPFRRRIRMIDVTQAKLVCIPRLAWLIVPRLTVRSGGPVATVFRAADIRVLAALLAIALATASGHFAQARGPR